MKVTNLAILRCCNVFVKWTILIAIFVRAHTFGSIISNRTETHSRQCGNQESLNLFGVENKKKIMHLKKRIKFNELFAPKILEFRVMNYDPFNWRDFCVPGILSESLTFFLFLFRKGMHYRPSVVWNLKAIDPAYIWGLFFPASMQGLIHNQIRIRFGSEELLLVPKPSWQ